MSGPLEPDDRYSVAQLAEQLGISRAFERRAGGRYSRVIGVV